MYTLSHSLTVNPPGIQTELSHDDLWSALVIKAEDATSFISTVNRCEVTSRRSERGIEWIMRTVYSDQGGFRERVELHAPSQLHFALIDMGGFIENTISTSDAGLQLAFTFGVVAPQTLPGYHEERGRPLALLATYIESIETTLARARELKALNHLP